MDWYTGCGISNLHRKGLLYETDSLPVAVYAFGLRLCFVFRRDDTGSHTEAQDSAVVGSATFDAAAYEKHKAYLTEKGQEIFDEFRGYENQATLTGYATEEFYDLGETITDGADTYAFYHWTITITVDAQSEESPFGPGSATVGEDGNIHNIGGNWRLVIHNPDSDEPGYHELLPGEGIEDNTLSAEENLLLYLREVFANAS